MTGFVAVGIHDGFYGAGTGAGYANQGFLTTLADQLAAGVQLVVLPVRLAPDSPEYRASWHAEMTAWTARVGASVRPVDNGTGGRSRFGGVAEFAAAGASAAAHLAELAGSDQRLAVVLFDPPFLDVAARVPALARCLAYVPRSTGLLHDPDNLARVGFERAGLRTVAELGGRIAPISRYMRQHLTGDYGVPDAALLDLPDGLTAAEWTPDGPVAPLPPAAERGFLLAYGRAQPYKGWDDLIDALTLLGPGQPHAVLAAVTDQPGITGYQRQLADRIAAAGLDATLLTRFDPGIRGLLRHPALRAVVVPSRTEPFGRVPLEAYAVGAGPVVVTATGGLPEQVEDGVTGFVAAPGEPAALAAAIDRATTVDDAGRARMRAAGQALARARFDHRVAVHRFFAGFAPWALARPDPGLSPGGTAHCS